MANEIVKTTGGHVSPFERIKRTNQAGMEFWSSREFAGILGYSDYRNFEGVIEKAKMACFNSGHRLEDHFVDVTEMVAIGSGAERPVKTILLSRYACYLAIQNADPKKEIVKPSGNWAARCPKNCRWWKASRRLRLNSASNSARLRRLRKGTANEREPNYLLASISVHSRLIAREVICPGPKS